jgi:site-specific DNA recombinase
LTDGILDQLAKFERAKLAERSRRGKLRKAREGKVVAGALPNFGFRYNVSRDNYILDEETMPVVRRIFHMVGLEKRVLNSVKRTLEAEGVMTPTGNKYWRTRTIRTIILDDVYRPHTYEEIKAMITPEVAGRLDPNKSYGVWWFNRERISRQQVAEVSPNGRVYREKVKTTTRPKEEWIAVPVPDSGILREVVDAAREAIADNRRASSNGDRFWELSGGILHCSACGLRMKTNVTRKATKRYYYYFCKKHLEEQDTCPNGKNYRADMLEPAVWELVCELLQNPEQLRADLEEMIEQEREGTRGNPHQETKVWLEKLAEVDRMRGGYQEMVAKGLMTFEELGVKLEALENTRSRATRELEVLRNRRERIDGIERDKDALLESYAGMVPQALDSLTPEERHQIYKMLRVQVTVGPDGRVEVTGALCASPEVCNTGSAPRCSTGGTRPRAGPRTARPRARHGASRVVPSRGNAPPL